MVVQLDSETICGNGITTSTIGYGTNSNEAPNVAESTSFRSSLWAEDN